ncbi:MAG TPA: zinc-binding alcohol dehydrogenase family protein [Thermoleophilaceae bacterium]
MKAVVIEEIGKGPVYKDADEPRRGEGQTLIEVLAAPLNPIDISTAAGSYPGGSAEPPYVAGREAVGRVLESDSLNDGTLVYAAGLGYMAERALVGDGDALVVPEDVDPALAACLGVAGLAAWLAVDWRGDLREGETVLVLGASGAVGAIAVQAAKLLGAGRVVAAARSEAGLERASELGADAAVPLAGQDDLATAFIEACDGQLDLVIDPVWGEPGAAAVKATSFGGRVVQLGQSAGKEAVLESGWIRTKLLSILGHTTFAAPAEVRNDAYLRMVRHAAAGDLTVDFELVPLERVAEAWERQEASPNCKLVLSPSGVP